MSTLLLPFQTLAWLKHAADAGQQDALVMLHLVARADKGDQDVAEFVNSYSKTIAALCRRLEALERGARLRHPVKDAPVEDAPMVNAGPMNRTQAALKAEPEGEGQEPSVADVDELCAQFGFHYADLDSLEILRDMIADALARWGHPPAAAPEPGGNLATPPAPEPGEVEELLTNNGVFKGAHGIEGLLSADAFWEQQPYGTRLYYGDGNADYLHRDVLRSAATLLQRLASPVYLVVGRPPEGFSDLLMSQPGEVQICSTGVSIEPLGDAARPTFQDAIRLAEGCHDYSGGHSGIEGEAWHGAINLVVDVLKRAAAGPWDSQIRAVYGVGAEARAGEVAVPVAVSERLAGEEQS